MQHPLLENPQQKAAVLGLTRNIQRKRKMTFVALRLDNQLPQNSVPMVGLSCRNKALYRRIIVLYRRKAELAAESWALPTNHDTLPANHRALPTNHSALPSNHSALPTDPVLIRQNRQFSCRKSLHIRRNWVKRRNDLLSRWILLLKRRINLLSRRIRTLSRWIPRSSVRIVNFPVDSLCSLVGTGSSDGMICSPDESSRSPDESSRSPDESSGSPVEKRSSPDEK